MKDELWENALTDARERAEKTLKASGMKVDSVFALSPVSFPEIIHQIFPSDVPRAAAAAYAPSQEARSQYRLAPVTIRQSVHVIYLISPLK